MATGLKPMTTEVVDKCTEANIEHGLVVISLPAALVDNPTIAKQIEDTLAQRLVMAMYCREWDQANDALHDLQRFVGYRRALADRELF